MCIFLHKFKIAETVHFSDSVFFVSFYQFLKAACLETAALLEGCDLWLFWSLRCAGDCAQLETAHHFDILWYMLRTSLNPNFVEVLIEIHIYCCLVFFSLWKRYRLTAWCFSNFCIEVVIGIDIASLRVPMLRQAAAIFHPVGKWAWAPVAACDCADWRELFTT